MQRCFDILLSTLAISVLFVVLFPIVIVLKYTGEGEIFYVQERIGRGGSKFGLLKFATMLKNSPNMGAGDITVANDPRVLPFGQFLRKTKLNELPQLWNILLGDMSIVGPRPLVAKTYEQYSLEVKEKIKTVRPGLTGIGSIIFRDEERYLDGRDNPLDFYNKKIMPYKGELEKWFVENNSLWIYFKIIAVTAWVVIFNHSSISDKVFQGLPLLPNELAEK